MESSSKGTATGVADPTLNTRTVVRLRLGTEARTGGANPPGEVAIESMLRDPSLPTGVKSALQQLAHEGGGVETLRSVSASQEGWFAVPVFDLILERLCTGGMIAATEEVPGSNEPLLTINSLPAQLLEEENDGLARLHNGANYSLSRFLVLRPVDGDWRVESATSPLVITIHDASLLGAVALLRGPLPAKTLRQLSSTFKSRLLVSALLAGRMIENVGEVDSKDMPPWDYHDLLFHSRSRLGRHNQPYGGTYRGRGAYAAPGAAMPRTGGKRTELPRPRLDRLIESDPPFAKVAEERRSVRKWGEKPLTLDQIGEFLFRCCRTKTVSPEGNEWQTASRPYPGGGAVYELEVYPLIRECGDLGPGLYHYNSVDHALDLLREPDALTGEMLKAAWHTLAQIDHPPVLFTVTARFDRLFWKYQSMAYALALKDVGVLYQTMYLTATAMGLGGCALGGGNSDLFANASGRPYYQEGAVGEFALGPSGGNET